MSYQTPNQGGKGQSMKKTACPKQAAVWFVEDCEEFREVGMNSLAAYLLMAAHHRPERIAASCIYLTRSRPNEHHFGNQS
jgi:hypothetical protein